MTTVAVDQRIPFPAAEPLSPKILQLPSSPSKTPLVAKMVNSISNRSASGRRDSLNSATTNEEVAALREQLARARADLSLARSQLARLDPVPASLSSPSTRVRRPSTPSSISSRPLSPGATTQIPLPRRKGMRTLSATSEGSDVASIRLVSSSNPGAAPSSSSSYTGPAAVRGSPSSRAGDPSGVSRIPVSAVSFGRVLAGDPSPPHASRRSGQPSTVLEEDDTLLPSIQTDGDGEEKALPRRRPRVASRTVTPDPSSELPPSLIPRAITPSAPDSPSLSSVTSTSNSTAVRSSRANPFFSSGGGRDRGAMIHSGAAALSGSGGNTSKVITTLQTDLLYARTALEQSKSQLRQNQRATESLTRQVDDLRDSMSRGRLENEGLTKMVNRKERTVSELMERVKKAEGELGGLKTERKELETGMKRIAKESEEKVKDAEGRRERAEVAYEAMKAAMDGLAEGWRTEKEVVRKDVEQLVTGMKKEGDELKLKYQTLAKLHASRSSALSSLTATVEDLRSSRDQFAARYAAEFSDLRAQIEAAKGSELEANRIAAEVEDECKRLKRMLRGGAATPQKPLAAG